MDTLPLPVGAIVEDVLALENGGVLVAASVSGQLAVVSTNGAGDTVWTRHYAVSTPTNEMIQLLDGSIVFAGDNQALIIAEDGDSLRTLPFGGVDVLERGTGELLFVRPGDLWLCDAAGGIIWQRSYSTDAYYRLGPASLKPTGEMLVLGAYTGAMVETDSSVVYLLRFDHDGIQQDSTTLCWDNASPLYHLPDMTALQAGGCVGMAHHAGQTGLVRTDAAGDTLWTREIGLLSDLPGSPYAFIGSGVRELQDGTIAVTGLVPDGESLTCEVAVLSADGQLLCLVPIANSGSPFNGMEAPCSLGPNGTLHVLGPRSVNGTTAEQLLAGVEEPCLSTAVNEGQVTTTSVFPNPASGLLFIEFDGPPDGTMFSLLDLSGRSVLSRTSATLLTTLNVSGLASGQYVLLVQRGGAVVRSERVSVIH